MNSRISGAIPSSFSHCSRYNVTGKRPRPYTDRAPFSLTLSDICPRAGRFSASFSARNRSISACNSSSDGMVFSPVIPQQCPCYAESSLKMSSFDSVFFDFDGVLMDSEPVHWSTWAEVLLRDGVRLDWEFYRDHCIGM